jgi:hypothetical protein
MKLKTTTFAMALIAGASLAPAQDNRDTEQRPERRRCPEWAVDPCGGPHHERGDQRERRESVRVWDPNLAEWRVENPRRVWDPNLAQYRYESRDEVWDPYLARYRPRDARKDPPAPARATDGRHRHPGRSEWCFARH